MFYFYFFSVRFLSRSWYVQFSEKPSIYHQILLLVGKDTLKKNSYSFWTIPLLKDTGGHIISSSRLSSQPWKSWAQTTQERPALMSQLAGFWKLPQIFSLKCSQISRADFPPPNTKLFNEASKETCMDPCCVTSTCVHPLDLMSYIVKLMPWLIQNRGH